MQPDAIKTLFDANATVIMFAVGLVWKYVPQLKNVSNQLIPWVNVVGYILLSLLGATPAHASILGGIPGTIGFLIPAFTSSIWARQLYEGFGRHLLESILKIKNPAKA